MEPVEPQAMLTGLTIVLLAAVFSGNVAGANVIEAPLEVCHRPGGTELTHGRRAGIIARTHGTLVTMCVGEMLARRARIPREEQR
jgi:hypothetical protein